MNGLDNVYDGPIFQGLSLFIFEFIIPLPFIKNLMCMIAIFLSALHMSEIPDTMSCPFSPPSPSPSLLFLVWIFQ